MLIGNKTAGNKVLPKSGLTQYYWANKSKSTFVILLSGSAGNLPSQICKMLGVILTHKSSEKFV